VELSDKLFTTTMGCKATILRLIYLNLQPETLVESNTVAKLPKSK